MKKLKLQNEVFKLFVVNYREWLDILGYAESTVYYLPNHLQEFFYYLEQNHVKNINNITTKSIKNYYNYLQERANETRNGSLSKSYLNKHQQALKKFKEYLQNHNYKGFNLHLKSERNPTEEKLNILTQNEAKQLFKATEFSHTESRFKLRDKAILTILYSLDYEEMKQYILILVIFFLIRNVYLLEKGKIIKKGLCQSIEKTQKY